jgi:hypothetical protein
MPVWVSSAPTFLNFGFDFYPAKEAVFPLLSSAGPTISLPTANGFGVKLGIEFPESADTALLFDSCFCFEDLIVALADIGSIALLINFSVPNGSVSLKDLKWQAIFRRQDTGTQTTRNFGAGTESVSKETVLSILPVADEIYQAQIEFTREEIDEASFGDPFQILIARLGADVEDDYLDPAIFLSAELIIIPFTT